MMRDFDLAEAVITGICVVGGALYGCLLMLLFVMFLAIYPSTKARAHAEHHSSYQNWVNKAGQGCCNNQDCRELASADERTSRGFMEVRIEGEWCKVEAKHYLKSGNVPNAATSHVCAWKQSPTHPGGPCERMLCYQPQPGI